MSFNSVVSSRLEYTAPHSEHDFAGIGRGRGVRPLFPLASVSGSSTNLDARGEERLAERTRIAQELHDTLLQGFIAASMQLHAAVDQLPADCATAKPRFSRVLQLLDRVIEEGRSALQGLHSPDERLTSIGEAFASVPNDLGFSSAVGFRVAVHGRERELRAGLRDEVYRIGREADYQCLPPFPRDRDRDRGRVSAHELRIVVRDNGCGIAPQELRWERDGHWGLQGMRERAERIGAQLCLSSKVALGTEVELRVPGRIAFQQAATAAAH